MRTYYIDYLNSEISLKQEDIEAVPLSGPADEACSNIADKAYIKRQFQNKSFQVLKKAVTNLFDNPEVKSRKDAIMYLVWMAALDIKESDCPKSSNNDLKVCDKDGFVWLVLTTEQARKLWKIDVFPLYVLYNDDSESMIESEEELENDIRQGFPIGIEVGFLSEMGEVYKISACHRH